MKNTYLLAIAATLAFVATSACSSSNERDRATLPAANPATAAVKTMPPSLANIGEYGENIYDAAQSGNWQVASTKLQALSDAVKQFHVEAPDAMDAQNRLTPQLAALDKAVGAKNKLDTMRESNQVTLIAAELSAPYNPKVPVDIVKLDYLGRELQVWSMAKDESKLKSTSSDIRATWDRVKGQVEAHGGQAQATKFESLVDQVEKAKAPAAYNRVATGILDQVDNLEKVF